MDISVFGTMSGTGRSEIRTALRFLGLIDDEYTVTERFKELIATYGKPEWPNALGSVLDDAYGPILETVAVENDTLSKLHERFRSVGGLVQAVGVKKAVRFWMAAMHDAQRKVSPHFGAASTTVTASANGAPKAKTRPPAKPKAAAEVPLKDKSGTKSVPFLIPGKPAVHIVMPDDITLDEWAMVDSYLRAYIKLNKGGK